MQYGASFRNEELSGSVLPKVATEQADKRSFNAVVSAPFRGSSRALCCKTHTIFVAFKRTGTFPFRRDDRLPSCIVTQACDLIVALSSPEENTNGLRALYAAPTRERRLQAISSRFDSKQPQNPFRI